MLLLKNIMMIRKKKRKAYARHMEYFLTNDITSAIPVGVAAANGGEVCNRERY